MQISHSKSVQRGFSRTPVAAGILLALASPALLAQESGVIDEIIVTSQKRTENLQDVPISIETLGNKQITELNLQNFADYTKMLPAVAIQPSTGAGSSFSQVYMRGIATAGDGQATTSLPSVSMYLDELPLTTIQGNLDVHLYDIARVEALAGPQGTLYGASAQAGTIRVITNRPEVGQWSSSLSLEGNMVDGDDSGYVAEGYLNAPLGDNAAIRLVGWKRLDAGWIDNVRGTRTFRGNENMDPASGTYCGSTTDCSADDITLDNASLAEDNFNTIDTTGGRAALRVDLNDNWTISPTVMAQSAYQDGAWADDLSSFSPGKNQVTHFSKEYMDDKWWMVGLTIEGKIANFDVIYSGSYLDRDIEGSWDYSDYSYWYDAAYTTGFYADIGFADTGPRAYANQFESSFPPGSIGSRVQSGNRFSQDDRYTKENHEVRISTDPDNRIFGTLGFFWQHQYHDFEQHWLMEGGVGSVMQMNGGTDPRFRDTVYLNSMYRNDRDRAVFASVSFDVTDDLELTVGTRFFEPEVSVEGFFGFGLGYETVGWTGGTGEFQCNQFPEGQADWSNKPCKNVRKTLKESDNVSRVNLTYSISDEAMIYGTWSEGYRPGGVQRNPAAGAYLSDFLTNIEFGWKTQWLDNRLQFNGAIFNETWDDIQVSFTGDNAITAVNNGPTAEVNGLESQFLWLPTDDLTLTASVAFYDSELKDVYGNFDAMGNLTKVLAPAGTALPVTADFKGNFVARYHFQLGSFDAHVQGAVAHEGKRGSDLDQSANAILGDIPAYTIVDLSAGIAKETWAVELFVKNATDEDAPLLKGTECTAETCGTQLYGARVRPLTFALRFTKDFTF